jgi:hypothetical protein
VAAQPPHPNGSGTRTTWLDAYREPAGRLIGEATSNTFAWQRLAVLTDTIGNRLSGSPALDRAIEWAVAEMKKDGLENVHTERVMVPKWVRGAESADLVEPVRHPWPCSDSAIASARRAMVVRGEVVVVHSFEELDAKAATARAAASCCSTRRSRITAKRFASDPTVRHAPRSYGAVAALVRSVGPDGLRLPHTGALQYTNDAPKIPAAAISSEDADRLQRMTERGERAVVELRMEAHFDPDCRIGQRHRRTARPHEARRSRRGQRPSRLMGRRRRRDRRWRRLHRDVGSAAADEGAQPAAAPHGARRAVDQRGERRPRRAGLPRSASRRTEQTRDDARIGRRRVPAAGLRVQRIRPRRARPCARSRRF